MQSTTALLILNMVPSVVERTPDFNGLSPQIAQLMAHFKLYEQPICALHSNAQETRLVDSLQRSASDLWWIFTPDTHPFDAPAFQAWFNLQSDEQDYLLVGVHSDEAVFHLAQALHDHFTQRHSDQVVQVVLDAIGPSHPPTLEALRQLGVEAILTQDFINA